MATAEIKKEYKLTIGADPEFFVYDKREHRIVPSCARFGGAKNAPLFLSPDGGFLEDGATLEFNMTPSSSLADTRVKLSGLLCLFLNKHDNYSISAESSAEFPKSELEKYVEAMHIGCSPDMFAYGLRTTPSVSKFRNRRFAGGHIHVGIDPWPEGLQKQNLIFFLDLLLGAPMAARFGDPWRYQFYGHPGLYRETSYGIEYRSPDNRWGNIVEKTSSFVSLVIEYFDTAMRHLTYLCSSDGHGGRVNDEIRKYVDSVGLKQSMNSFSILSNPSKMQGWSDSYRDVQYAMKRWITNRESRKLSPWSGHSVTYPTIPEMQNLLQLPVSES